MLDALRKAFLAYVAGKMAQGMGGTEAACAVADEAEAPWLLKGVRDACHLFGIERADTQAAFVIGKSFEAGALSALRHARTILSDPAVKGHEALALEMIEAGAGHADILAAVRSAHERAASERTNVLAFPLPQAGRAGP